MNQLQTILHKLAGQSMPEKLLEVSIRRCPTVSGLAIRDVVDGKGELSIEKEMKSANLADLIKINEAAKDSDAVIYLGNVPGKHTKDDVQPFVVTIFADDNDKVGTDILATFVEGDFPKYSKPDSGHTDEYNFYHEYVAPKLQELYEDVDFDLAKFYAKLHKPSFEKDLVAQAGHRCAFVFLPCEGDAIKFGENEDLGRGYDWGTTSQHHDWDKVVEEKKPIIEQAKEVVAKGRRAIFGSSTAAPPVIPNATPEPEKLPDGVHRVPEKKNDPVEKTATAINAGKHFVKVPAKLEQSAKNFWLRLMNDGKLPPDHLSKDVGVWVTSDILPFAQRDISTKNHVQALEKEMRTGVKKTAEAPKEVSASQTAKVEEKKSSPADYLPILDDKEMVALTGSLAKFLDRSKVPSALEIQKMEAKFKTFSETAGIPFADTMRWTTNDAMQLEKKAIILLWLQTRRMLIESGFKLEDLVNTAPVKEVPTQQSKTAEVPPVAASAAPKRRAIFGNAA